MTTPLTLIPARLPDGTGVLAAAGEIDMSNCARFGAAIAAALDGDQARLVVDLGAVAYLDSAALGVLFGHADRIEIVANSLLAPVLTMTGLTEVVAVRGLDAPPPAEPMKA